MLRIIVAVLVLLAPAAAPAVEFDTDLYCRDVSKEAADRDRAEESCRQREQAARAALDGMTISSGIESQCATQAKAVGGSYAVMERCVRQRTAETGAE